MKSSAKYMILLAAVSPFFACSLIFADPNTTEPEPSPTVEACRSYAAAAHSVAEECGVTLRDFQCEEEDARRVCKGGAEYYRCLEDNIECVGREIRHNDAACELDCGPSNAQRCSEILGTPDVDENIRTLCSAMRTQTCDVNGVLDCLEFFGSSDAETLRLCARQSDCPGSFEVMAQCFEFSERPDVQACTDTGDNPCRELGRCDDPTVFACIDETFSCDNGQASASPECIRAFERCVNTQPEDSTSFEQCELFMLAANQCTATRASPSSCRSLRFLDENCQDVDSFFACLNETSLCTNDGWLSFPAYCSEQSACSKSTRQVANCISAHQRVQGLSCADQAWLTLDQCLGEVRDFSAAARYRCLQQRPRCEGSQLSFECYDEGFGEGEGEDEGFDEDDAP